jgi:hypothetical protein
MFRSPLLPLRRRRKLTLLNLLPAVILGSLPPIPSFIPTQKIREIMENLFIYNVAGHDTTANPICYAIYMLAA